jgi:hypothetical protein
MYSRCGTDGGWSELKAVQDEGRSFEPAFAAADTPYNITAIGSGVVSFGEVVLSDEVSSNWPTFAIDQTGGFHVVFVRLGDRPGLIYRYANDRGQTWSEPEALQGEASTFPGSARMTIAGQNRRHLVWADFGRIFYRRWTAETGWGEVVDLTQGSRGSGSTSIGLALDGDDLAHVAWQGAQRFRCAKIRMLPGANLTFCCKRAAVAPARKS